MDDDIPLYASHVHWAGTSPPHSIWMVSYHKARQTFKAVVDILKMIRIPGPLFERYQSGGDVIVGNDVWWFCFSFVPLFSMWDFFLHLEVKAEQHTFVIFFLGGNWSHIIVLYSVCYWHREMSPFRLIGAKAKFMIEVIPMIVEAALRHVLVFPSGYFSFLLGCTTYFYTFAHFMHAAYDIGGIDVLLGLAMLFFVRILNEELLGGALALGFCLCLSFYRYMTYCAPELPNHPKKELEELPC